MGADAVVVVYDYLQPMGAYVMGGYGPGASKRSLGARL
jgi:hypothetical protein